MAVLLSSSRLCDNNCDAQGKGRARGGPRKVTQKSFIDGGWWMVDILSLMLYIKFGCHPPPPYIRLLNQTFQNPPPQFLSLFLWPVGGAGRPTYLTHPYHLPQRLPVPNIPMAAVMFGAISDLKDDIKYNFCETLYFSCIKIWY